MSKEKKFLPMRTDGKNKEMGMFKTGAAMFINQFGAIGNSRKESSRRKRLLISCSICNTKLSALNNR